MESRILELEKLIIYHKERYYSGKPEISDEDFDHLENELKRLDPQNPVLNLVGSNVEDSSIKVQHEKKMLSLEKTYDYSDLVKWVDHHDVISIFKIDGSSCSLIYENGHLILGKTRGDGTYGENITSKILFMEEVPKSIKYSKRIEIRGEVFCKEENFLRLAEEMKSLNLVPPNSQRNIVAGLLGRKEHLQLSRYLSFKAFDVIGDLKLIKESDKFHLLKEFGFDILEFFLHQKKLNLNDRIEEAKRFMGEGNYLIDGLVFVYNDLKYHEELGETSHHPRYKLAFKFAGETKYTKIEDIEWGVSRNGILTPVAHVTPTELSGAMISRVTLHNLGIVKSFQLKKGDTIEIIRSGEVIPKFLSVISHSHLPFEIPRNCPSCGSHLIEENIWLKCKNLDCPEKIKAEILNYIQKSGVDDLSEKRLDEMLKKELIKELADIYKIKEEDLLKLDKVKEKLAKKIFENIQKSKKITLLNFISAIGIEGLSINKSEKIIGHGFNSLEKFLTLTKENLVNIEGFAEKSATDILSSLKSKLELIQKLLEVGVVVESFHAHIESDALQGKKICITGELSEPRAKIEKKIKENGGVVVGSVSKNTDFLLTNETNSSSSKFLKANSLGIKIISEKQFFEIIEDK